MYKLTDTFVLILRRLTGSLGGSVWVTLVIDVGVTRVGLGGLGPPKGVEKMYNRFSCAKGTNNIWKSYV